MAVWVTEKKQTNAQRQFQWTLSCLTFEDMSSSQLLLSTTSQQRPKPHYFWTTDFNKFVHLDDATDYIYGKSGAS